MGNACRSTHVVRAPDATWIAGARFCTRRPPLEFYLAPALDCVVLDFYSPPLEFYLAAGLDCVILNFLTKGWCSRREEREERKYDRERERERERFSSATRPSSRPREVLRGCGGNFFSATRTSSRLRERLLGHENLLSLSCCVTSCRVVSCR